LLNLEFPLFNYQNFNFLAPLLIALPVALAAFATGATTCFCTGFKSTVILGCKVTPTPNAI
jgi:hypothetical protein